MDTASPPKTKPRRPDSRPHRITAGPILPCIGALLLIGVCVICARWGLADRIVVDASERQSALQERIARTGEPADAREVASLADAFLLAQRFEPGNPDIPEQLGGLYALKVRDGSAGGVTGNQGANALEQFSSAVAMRPSSPYAWANLARIKYAQGQVDDVFYRALDNAMRLGPWEREVQFTVVDLGFALWDKAPTALRPQILSVVQNGLTRDAAQILAIAQKRGRLAEVCKFEKLASVAACKPISG